jgi:hypothetical protein
MAKQATSSNKGRASAPPPPKSRAVQTTSDKGRAVADAAAMEEMTKMMAADAGKGVSTAVEDNIVPLIYILQSNSPQVQKKGDSYVEGAEAGSIWFRGTQQVVSGDDGILVVPAYFSKCWIEWLPDRGGFVARHDEKPGDAFIWTDPQNPKKKGWRRKNGNSVVETREHVVIVLDEFDAPLPFVIPMSGSGHGASRAWMTLMNRKRVPGTDMKSPSYGYLYRMKLQFRTNDQGDWFMWNVDDEGGEPTMLTDPAVYRMARQIESDFTKGILKSDQMTGDQVDEGSDVQGSNAKGQRDSEHV